MAEKWAWGGEPENIHVVQEDAPHMRICFLTSDGPTEERANLISSAPDMAEALKPFVDFIDILEIIRPGRGDDKEFLEISVADDTKLVITFGDFRRAREALSKATGGSNG